MLAAALAVALVSCSKEPLDENVRALQPAPGSGRETGGTRGDSPSTPSGPETPGAGASGAVGAGAAPVGGAAGDDGQPSAPVAFTKRGLRESLADCAQASYREFAAAA